MNFIGEYKKPKKLFTTLWAILIRTFGIPKRYHKLITFCF